MKFRRVLMSRLVVSLCALTALSACNQLIGSADNAVVTQTAENRAKTTLTLSEDQLKQPLWQALELVRNNELKEANEILNVALKSDPEHANMHFLNAYIYELRGHTEGYEISELAPAGYLAAFNNDPHHWAAAYRLGLSFMESRDYANARTWLGEAIMIKDDSPEILQALARASYHLSDIDAADAFLKRAAELTGDTPENLRARAIINAAKNDKEVAEEFADKYLAIAPEQEGRRLKTRIRQWLSVHQNLGTSLQGQVGTSGYQNAQFFGGKKLAPLPKTKSVKSKSSNSKDEKPEELKKLPGMLVIDAVIIREKTSLQESRGVNLLKQLQVTFSGDVLNWARGGATGAKSTWTPTHTYKINLGSGTSGSITYSLNIANNTDSRTEVLARPAIAVVDGETGSFFLGEEVTYTVSGDNADSFDKEVGITFEVTPELLDDGKVRLQARAEFDTFTSKNDGVGFTLVIPTLKNKVTSTAILDIGQTLVLGGGTQEEKSKSKNDTPVLGDVPLLQYFFSEATSVETETSLIFLITPRWAETIDDKGSVGEAAGDQSAQTDEAVMSQLRRRFRAWFDPSSNLTKTLVGLSYSEIFREFRDGDLKFSDEDADGDFDRLLGNHGKEFLNTYEDGFLPEMLRYFYFD